MTISRKLSKYPNRSFDFTVMHGAAKTGSTLVDFSLVKDGGAVCTGLQKLAQRYVLCLMTDIGSMTFNSRRGCSFMKDVMRARDEDAVATAFQFARMDVAQQLRNEETDDMPDSEKYGSSELIDVSFFGDTLSIAIELQSVSGDSSDIILPIYA